MIGLVLNEYVLSKKNYILTEYEHKHTEFFKKSQNILGKA